MHLFYRHDHDINLATRQKGGRMWEAGRDCGPRRGRLRPPNSAARCGGPRAHNKGVKEELP